MGLPALRSPPAGETQELFSHAVVPASELKPCLAQLQRFAARYAACFRRSEQAKHGSTYLEGLLSDLVRKSIEPIAVDHHQPRRPLQRFVGAGRWDDQEVLKELQADVAEELGEPQGVLMVDGSGFPKKGTESCGVQRQWCGRLGKVDNCQVGVYLAYAGRGSATLVDSCLYLPRSWCRSKPRREKTHVPKNIRYRSTVQVANELLRRDAPRFPHAWVVGDDEFGRLPWFRHVLARRGERYLLEVPANTHIRDLEGPPPRRHPQGPAPKAPYLAVLAWAKTQPSKLWTRFRVRDGEKGPIEVRALRRRVQTRCERRNGPEELLLVTRTLDPQPEWRFWLAPGTCDASLAEMVRAASTRQWIEEALETAKSDCGMAQYEVRSWVGWHHHMSLALLAEWYLTLQQRRAGEKSARDHGLADGQRPAGAPAGSTH